MNKQTKKSLILVGLLIALTCAAMAWAGMRSPMIAAGPGAGVKPVPASPPTGANDGRISLSAGLSQSKVHSAGDRTFSLSLNLKGLAGPGKSDQGPRTENVDMVLVLDTSGSMSGQKIDEARRAVLNLLSGLDDKDRFALVTYSTKAVRHSNLLELSPGNRMLLTGAVNSMSAHGGTNLGSGLMEGMKIIEENQRPGRLARLILISDGLANHGIVDPNELGRIASKAVQKEYAVSTAGVGLDFNELLMTKIADQGGGGYYFIEQAQAFARVFLNEFHTMRNLAGSNIEIRVPLAHGVRLIDAAGYPVSTSDGMAVFRPGDIMAGSSRTLHLTFRAERPDRAEYSVSGLSLSYLDQGVRRELNLNDTFRVAMVKDANEALSSIDRKVWESKVVQEEYGKLKSEVSAAIKGGDKKQAMDKIRAYKEKQQAVNARVGSAKVKENLDKDVEKLEGAVNDSFSGPAAERELKQKRNSKIMQHDAYSQRRSKN